MRFYLIFLLLSCLVFSCTPEAETVSVKNFTLEVPPGFSYSKEQSGNKLISFSNGGNLKFYIEDGIGGVVRPGKIAAQYKDSGVEDFSFNHLFDRYYANYKGYERFPVEKKDINGNRYHHQRFFGMAGTREIYFDIGLLQIDSRYYTIVESGLQSEEPGYADKVEALIGSIRAK